MQLSSVFLPLFISAASSRVCGSAGQRPSPGCPQASPSLSFSPFRRNRCSPSTESFPPAQHGPAGARSTSNCSCSCSAPRGGPGEPGGIPRRCLPPPASPAAAPLPGVAGDSLPHASSAKDVVLPRNLSSAPKNVINFFLIHRMGFLQIFTAPHKRHCPTRKENGTKTPNESQLCRRPRPSAAQRSAARRGAARPGAPPAQPQCRLAAPARPRSLSAGHRARRARPAASGSPDAGLPGPPGCGRLRLL